jgi:hypothetical protein
MSASASRSCSFTTYLQVTEKLDAWLFSSGPGADVTMLNGSFRPFVFEMVYTSPSSRRNRGGVVPITVLLSDDKEVMRRSLRVLLDFDPEIQVVGEAGNFQQTVQSAIDLKPQIVVIGLHMLDARSVSPQKIKSVFNRLGSQLVAISFSFDQETRALAQSIGAVILLDKMVLATELIPAIKAATKQRSPRNSG